MDGELEVELLGPPRCRSNTGAWVALSMKDAAVLAVLALDGPQGRDALAGRLFPGASQQQAPNNLRKHISRLRKLTGHAIFEAGATVRLLPNVRVDALAVSLLPLDTLLERELLAGCDYSENDSLLSWAEVRRAQLRSARADAAAGHAETLERAGELAAAIRLALRIIELEPFQEVAWRRLMRLHYLRGDHTAAIDAFERFEAALRAETGARPGPETLRLLATIERGAQAQSLPQRRVPVNLVRPPRVVGRDAAWQGMARAWAGDRAFLLVGEAGIGKSRLLADFVAVHGESVSEHARPGDAQAPYTFLARLLRAVLERPGVVLDNALRAELARLLPELGAAPAAQGHEAHLRHAMEALLNTAHAAGLAVAAADDLHFADVASLEALRWLSSSATLRNLRWAFAARPLDHGPQATLLAAWLCDSRRPERIVLEPLDVDEVGHLLGALELPEFLAPGLAARLHAHAGGHPLFTLETLKDAWLHRRDLSGSDLPRPQTVQALIEGRLAELPGSALDLVRVCAVAGIDIDGERAALLLGVKPLALADAWTTLERAGFLQGQRFAHDLVQECALAGVPQPLRRALHGMLAEHLASDTRVPPARVADHWQRAQRWPEAGAGWYRAGQAARQAGRLQEQQEMLERAAACYRRAADPVAEFEAVRASFDSILLRSGGNAVLAALPRLEALASGPVAELECRLLRAEALLDVERSREALDEATAAVALASPRRLGDALGLRAMALAQLGRAEEAVAAAGDAADAAHASADAAQELRAVRSLSYALYSLGRLGDSLPVQRRAAELAAALGDEAESAAAEASMAALLGAAGDVPESHRLAARAARRYEVMGLDQNSTVGATNLLVWGSAAAYLGRFEEALQVLSAALHMASHDATVAAQAKARITLANVRLTLGDSAAARALVEPMPAATPPGMRMQAALVLARAERMQGGNGREHLDRLGRLGIEHPDLPLMQAAWVEWSYQGNTDVVLSRLAPLREELLRLGLPGAARSVQVREVHRLLDRNDASSVALAACGAAELEPHVAKAMNAKSYPPEAWLVLACAFERAQRGAEALRCRRAGVAWIRDTALPQVPAAARDGFLFHNPVNRALLGGAA